jgi:hypothetical protein
MAEPERNNDSSDTISIANWNLQIFGQTKASNEWSVALLD